MQTGYKTLFFSPLKIHLPDPYLALLNLVGKYIDNYFLKIFEFLLYYIRYYFLYLHGNSAALLFREAGIPARYVEGYKIRADQWRLGKAQVTDYEAHAWTEIYIEHIGWIPVEVTGRDTGESVNKHVEQEEKQRNAIVPNKKQFVTNVKKMFQMIPIVIILAVILCTGD